MLKHFFKVISRDFFFLSQSNLPWSFRLGFPFHKYAALIRSKIQKKNCLHYLGHQLHYQNWTIPISIQQYPQEITKSILKQLPQNPKLILDIGANIGQFALTINHFLPEAEIHCFEPNPQAFQFLQQNCQQINKIHHHNYGIGPAGKATLHLLAEASATASLLNKKISSKIKKRYAKQQAIEIQLSDQVSTLTKHKHFDLIKIDIEGYEYQALKHLQGITCQYLYIEIDTEKEKDYHHSQLFQQLEATFGQFDILSQDSISQQKKKSNLLIEFVRES